jgi:hypothetical protein
MTEASEKPVEEETERKPLPSIEEEFSDDALLIRTNVVSISASFGSGTEKHQTERKKLEKFIRLLAQQHLKSLAQCLKLLVVGTIKGEIPRAMAGIKAHLGALLAGQVAMSEERGRIWRGEAEPLLVTEAPSGLVGPDGETPLASDPPPEGHTEAPEGGTK